MKYEADDDSFAAEAYRVRYVRGVAWSVLGWETEPDEDTEWSGVEVRTGKVVAVMIGDDQHHAIDPEDLIELNREEFCGVCGQIGCTHDGLERAG
jgi:hypothetical protein